MTKTNLIEHEAARVAAAFGVETWKRDFSYPRCGYMLFRGCVKEIYCECGFEEGTSNLLFIAVGAVARANASCEIRFGEGGEIYLFPRVPFNDVMARGLYCLGFNDESILDQLPELSAHEKLELRLNLPREFWPQTWLDEA